jgi:hypothetical protein
MYTFGADVIYPASQFESIKATLQAVNSYGRARAAVDSAILYGNRTCDIVAPSGTIDAQRRAARQAIIDNENALIAVANSYLGHWSGATVKDGPANDAPISSSDWTALQQKIMYLYGLAFIEAGQFPTNAQSTLDALTTTVVQEVTSLPGRILAMPAASVQYLSKNVLQPLAKTASETITETLKNLWPVLAVAGVIGVGYVGYLFWQGRQLRALARKP